MKTEEDKDIVLQSIENDNKVKLERYYDGRKLRRYIQLLELSEQICRSDSTNYKAKKIARKFSDHYRRMVMCIVMKPFNEDTINTDNLNDKMFTYEVSRLNSLFDPNFDI